MTIIYRGKQTFMTSLPANAEIRRALAVRDDVMRTKYFAASAANARLDINGGSSIAENVMLDIICALELGESDNPKAVY